MNPKFTIKSPAIRAWAKKLKKILLSEEANLEVSEEMLRELDSIIEPAKPQFVESK